MCKEARQFHVIRFQAKKDGAEDTIAKYDGEWAIEQLLKDPLTGKVTRSHDYCNKATQLVKLSVLLSQCLSNCGILIFTFTVIA